MTDLPDTRESLLLRVQDPKDQEAWEQFVTIYQPVVYRMARSRGLQDADAHDLTQRVMLSVSVAIQDWHPSTKETRFRNWLLRVSKNALINALTRQPKDLATGDSATIRQLDAALNKQTDAADVEHEFDLVYRRQVYRRAAEMVRSRADETTWLAFSLTMVDGMSVTDAAQQLDRSPGMIYASRSRIMRRLQNTVKELTADEGAQS